MERKVLFLWKGLTEEELQLCRDSSAAEEVSFAKGDTVYGPDHAERALAYVLEGHLQVCYGRVVMNDLFPGDVFGSAALFGSDEPYPSTVVAHADCRILMIPQETVLKWMSLVPKVGENYVRFLSERIRFLNRRLCTLTACGTNGKLWQYLLAHRGQDGAVQVKGGMTELARRLDMGRSSLYRCVDTLTDAGRIRREGKKIFVLEE